MTLRFGILTVSDRSARGERPDLSGPALRELVTAQGWKVEKTAILPDDLTGLRECLSAWADGPLTVNATAGFRNNQGKTAANADAGARHESGEGRFWACFGLSA